MLKPQDSKSIYPDALVDEIAAAIGIDDPRRRRLLAEGLRDVAQHADSCRRTYSIAPPGVRAEALDRIKVAYDQLLASLQIDPANPDPQRAIHGHDALPFIIWHVAAGRNPQWPEGQITPAQEGFEDQVKSLLEFREATIAALCDTEPRITRGRGGARRRPDEALELVAYMLTGIYKHVAGVEIGSSINSEGVGGPGVRFMQLSLKPLGWKKSASQVSALIRKVKTSRRFDGM